VADRLAGHHDRLLDRRCVLAFPSLDALRTATRFSRSVDGSGGRPEAHRAGLDPSFMRATPIRRCLTPCELNAMVSSDGHRFPTWCTRLTTRCSPAFEWSYLRTSRFVDPACPRVAQPPRHAPSRLPSPAVVRSNRRSTADLAGERACCGTSVIGTHAPGVSFATFCRAQVGEAGRSSSARPLD